VARNVTFLGDLRGDVEGALLPISPVPPLSVSTTIDSSDHDNAVRLDHRTCVLGWQDVMQKSPVIEELRGALTTSRTASAFIEVLENRIRQLIADMVDGRVLPKPEANALRASVIELVAREALPKLRARSPNDALRVLDRLKAYGFAQLESERPSLERARASRFPAPRALSWPELAELRAAAEAHPDVCKLGSPVDSIYFAKELKDDGILLPDEVLGLYAACDGFDLSCLAVPQVPVFSLLPAAAIDTSDEGDGYPRRAAVFQGGDEIQLSVYRDKKKRWWLVYEYEYEPIAKKSLDLRELIRFGVQRMNVSVADALGGDLSWERFFGVSGRE